MIASDLNNPEFAGATNPDGRLVARFYNLPVQNEFKTLQEGRPIFEDVDYIEIFSPGDSLSVIKTPARDDHRERFPRHWAAYQNARGGEQKTIGTPLTQWPLLTASQGEELRALKFYTVESIAQASDAAIQKVGMSAGMSPFAFRDRAKNYLRVAYQEAVESNAQAEADKLREENAKLKAETDAKLEEMQRQMNEMMAQMQAKKPGPKAKDQIQEAA